MQCLPSCVLLLLHWFAPWLNLIFRLTNVGLLFGCIWSWIAQWKNFTVKFRLTTKFFRFFCANLFDEFFKLRCVSFFCGFSLTRRRWRSCSAVCCCAPAEIYNPAVLLEISEKEMSDFYWWFCQLSEWFQQKYKTCKHEISGQSRRKNERLPRARQMPAGSDTSCNPWLFAFVLFTSWSHTTCGQLGAANYEWPVRAANYEWPVGVANYEWSTTSGMVNYEWPVGVANYEQPWPCLWLP